MSRIVLVTVAAATLAPLPLSRGASAADLLGGRGPDLLGARDRLLGARDPGLAAEVEAVAEDLGITQLARGGRASLVLVDLTRGSPVHAGIAGDSTLGAASVAKLAILVGAFAAIEKGFSIARKASRLRRAGERPGQRGHVDVHRLIARRHAGPAGRAGGDARAVVVVGCRAAWIGCRGRRRD